MGGISSWHKVASNCVLVYGMEWLYRSFYLLFVNH